MDVFEAFQWVVIAIMVLGLVGFVLYAVYRLIRTLDKADRYFDRKERETGQPVKS